MTVTANRTTPLRIAIAADPDLPVPPVHYGGIERIIHFLAEGLVARGHAVTLFAHRDSSSAMCALRPYPGLTSRSKIDTLANTAWLTAHVLTGGFDLIHSFGRLAYLTGLGLSRIPKLMSFQRPITRASVESAARLFGRSLQFTACGEHMIGDLADLAPWHVVPNGVPLERYTFVPAVDSDAPLVFLGRVEQIKGPHLAIEAARHAGRRLVIAGNVPSEHQPFFDREILPHIDGTTVTYLGPVDDAQKNRLLGGAAALLMPVEWDEPFGIVMAEALACGTPVIGFARGAVPEVVNEGVTGFTATTVAGITAAVGRLGEISRHACRAAAEHRFSDAVIVRRYEAIYRTLVANPRVAPGHGIIRQGIT